MKTRPSFLLATVALSAMALPALVPLGCSSGSSASAGGGGGGAADDCHAAPRIMTTSAGVSFVRTPDSCFANIPDFPFEPKYVELDGLRQAYVDEGPRGGSVVLLLHGEPSWSYLYRKMIPVLVAAGHRVIAMDHLGMGRSDKPTDIASYTYLGHADRLTRFIQTLGLSDITLFVQDWGSLIGLHVAGLHPELFARIALGDGTLPVFPAGVQPLTPIASPDVPDPSAPDPFASIPPQQPPFRDAAGSLLPAGSTASDFGAWASYAMRSPAFTAGEVVEALTWFPLPPAVRAAYDAPFPSREYMAGARVFPSLIDQVGGQNQAAWAGLQAFTKPFVTVWSSNDPGNLGDPATQLNFIDNVPGAKGQPHTRLADASHFLQDDQGAAIADLLVAWMDGDAGAGDFPPDAGVDGGSTTGDAGLTCTSGSTCASATPTCCATIPVSGGSPPTCTTSAPTSVCAAPTDCTTSLGAGCAGARTVRLCATSAECTEPAYPSCCAFDNGAIHFCANTTIAAIAGGTCP